MGRKRRFGVSLPEDVASDLDSLAEMLKVDRSKLVSEAVRTYVRDHAHYLIPHECYGVITLISNDNLKLLKVIEEFKDIIREFTHVHIEENCVNALVVSGSSTKIAELHRKLLDAFRNVRFVPLGECKI